MNLVETEIDSDNELVITKEEYQDLIESSVMLSCLQNAGVDGWSGFEIACQEFDGIFKYGEDE